MAGLSNYMENNILVWLKGTAFPAAPANSYVALLTAAPTDAGGGTEVSGNAYARVAIASTAWSAVSGGGASPEQISNANLLTFPTPTASWGNIVAIGLYDASTVGNLIAWVAISSTAIASGASVTIAIGALVLSID